jgi:hypothetical protein
LPHGPPLASPRRAAGIVGVIHPVSEPFHDEEAPGSVVRQSRSPSPRARRRRSPI